MQANKVIFKAILLLCLLSSQAFSEITYQFLPREGKESLWSLDGGWITTDGTIGEITFSNLIDWEIRFSSPSGHSVISDSNGGVYFFKSTYEIDSSTPQPESPTIQATPNQLSLNPKRGELFYLLFSTEDVFSGAYEGNAVGFMPTYSGMVRYANNGYFGGLLIDNTVNSSSPVDPFHFVSSSPNRSLFATPQGRLILGATIPVPEPASCPLLLFTTILLTLTKHRSR